MFFSYSQFLWFIYFLFSPFFLGLHLWHMEVRGWIRAIAAGLCPRHSNAGSEPCLEPPSQLTAMLALTH